MPHAHSTISHAAPPSTPYDGGDGVAAAGSSVVGVDVGVVFGGGGEEGGGRMA